ncbi:MAG: hypothetical protein ACTSYB_14195 [Candidatus Helarchaeota archaeon]
MEKIWKKVEKFIDSYCALRFKFEEENRMKETYKFFGSYFSSFMEELIQSFLPTRRRFIMGPLWIEGMEDIEIDGIIIKEESLDSKDGLHRTRWFKPYMISAIFEFKAHGLYGGRKDLNKQIRKLNTIAKRIKKLCDNNNLPCFYITLQERTPKKANSINYKKITLTGLTEWHSFFLYNSDIVEDRRKGRPLRPYKENGLEALIIALKEMD